VTYFEDPQHAAEAADEERSDRIAAYLARHEIRDRDAFFTTLDQAINAEDWAKLCGLYPPAGHSYPREEYL
jgi:exoribonuclease II